MFSLKRDNSAIDAFLKRAGADSFSYEAVGASRMGSPAGYNRDHNRVQIGQGRDDFEKAKTAVRSWKMFDISWAEIHRDDTPIEAGKNVAVLISHLGFYSLNACRIVYVIDEPNTVERYGFAYGTLTDHGETGEERFSVEFHPETGEVWYDLFAFSKPNHLLAKIGYPVARIFQKRFVRDSLAAMKRAVQ